MLRPLSETFKGVWEQDYVHFMCRAKSMKSVYTLDLYIINTVEIFFVCLSNHALAGAYKPLHGAQKFLVMIS